MTWSILLVEDEPGVVLTLTDLLRTEGYRVESVADGPAALRRVTEQRFDVVILDVMLPGMSGFDVCSKLRQRGQPVAILMLTARAQLSDRVAGLKLGADDYLTKPFEPPELLARIEALLRRVKKPEAEPLARIQFGNIELDFGLNEIKKNGELVSMAGKEIELLRYLIEHQGSVVSRDELLEAVWGYQPGISSRTIDVHVVWLRQKLEDNPQHPRYIQTIRGVGYRFSK